MTTTKENFGGLLKRHRTSAIIGGGAGLILLTTLFGYEVLMTPSRPNVATAKAAEVVAYIGDDRGLGALSQIEQQQFLEQWKSHVAAEPYKAELRDCFAKLEDEPRKRFSTALAKQLKRSFMDDAKRFNQLATPQEKGQLVRTKVAEYRDQALFMKGVAVGFKNEIGRSPDDVQKWVMENTTAEERAIGEPYVDALKRVREQLRKEEPKGKPSTGGASASATKP